LRHKVRQEIFKRDVFGVIANLFELNWDISIIENIGFFLNHVTKNLDTKNINFLKEGPG
jgi:hypothetical protein